MLNDLSEGVSVSSPEFIISMVLSVRDPVLPSNIWHWVICRGTDTGFVAVKSLG